MVIIITQVRSIFRHNDDEIGDISRHHMTVIAPSPSVGSCFIIWGNVDFSYLSLILRRLLNSLSTHLDQSIVRDGT